MPSFCVSAIHHKCLVVLCMSSVVPTRTQYFDVKKVAQVVGADKCKALLGLHASQGVTLFIGGAPIGAGGHDPPTFRGKGDRGT